ncbi:MAG: rRNA maturation RNase YbeY [Acidobacteria bacterium]|nr:rRNA maturation RNase YbeY [Acidobacteriota bacterium]
MAARRAGPKTVSPDREYELLIGRPQACPARLRRGALRAFARRLSDHVAGGRRFQCLLTGDRELRRLNRQFLGHDYPTDVLSFPDPSPDGFLGELAISVDRAGAQARQYGHTLLDEIRILMLHGVLHLLGMDHETDGGRMARAETRWRRKLDLPAGLIERVRP